MLKKSLLSVALLAAAFAVQAQSSPAKKELAAKIVKLQMAGIEAMAQQLAEQPAAELMASAGAALQSRVPADKREAVAKQIQADAQKYAQDAGAVVRASAAAAAPGTIGAMLEEKFTEDELRQIVALIESSAYAKFQQLGGEMQKALIEKVVSDTRSTIEPKVRELDETIAKRLGITEGESGAKSAKPAKPAKKQ